MRYVSHSNARIDSLTYKYMSEDAKHNESLVLQHGIGKDEYDKMYFSQSGCCAICGIHQSELKKRLAVDHDHKTGKIRGLLCSNCNCAIGLLHDEPVVIEMALTYLDTNR